MSEPSRSSSHRRCPQCRGRLVRVEREPGDKLLADAESWRRFRCRNEACRWGGLLEVHRRRRNKLEQVDSIPRVVRMAAAAMALLLVAGLSWTLFHMLASLIEN